jgi:hypothetical protein
MVTGEQSHSGYHDEVPDALVYVYVPSIIIMNKRNSVIACTRWGCLSAKEIMLVLWLVSVITKRDIKTNKNDQAQQKI